MEVPQIDLPATGNNIRRIRKEMGISVLEISELLMIDKQAVYRWEYGKSLPQLENFLALARMFHTTIENITHLFFPSEIQFATTQHRSMQSSMMI